MGKYREVEPHAPLREHVKCFWTMERDYTPEHPFEDVTPDGFIELILNFGAPYHLQADGAPDREMPRVIVVGLQAKPLRFRCEGTVELIAARFFAWGALSFLADRAHGLGRLRTTFDREWTDLATKVDASRAPGDGSTAVAVLEDHLIEKLLTASVDPATIRAAARMLHLKKGQF